MLTILSYLGHKNTVADDEEGLADFQVKDNHCTPWDQQSWPFLIESEEAGQAQSTLGKASYLLFQTPRNGIQVDTLSGTNSSFTAHPLAIFKM